MASAALTLHLSAAAPAYYPALQNVICWLSLRNHIVCSGLECFLNGIKLDGINQRFMGGLHRPLFLPLYQHPRVCAIGKDVLYGPAVPTTIAIVKVSIQTASPGVLDRCGEAPLIQIPNDTGHTSAACRHLKNLPNNNSRCRIRDKLVRILAGLLITKRSSRPDKFSTLCFHV